MIAVALSPDSWAAAHVACAFVPWFRLMWCIYSSSPALKALMQQTCSLSIWFARDRLAACVSASDFFCGRQEARDESASRFAVFMAKGEETMNNPFLLLSSVSCRHACLAHPFFLLLLSLSCQLNSPSLSLSLALLFRHPTASVN